MAEKKDKKEYKSLFEKLYNEGAEALKAGDQSLIRRQLARQWEAAHDNAEGKLLSNQVAINAEYGKLKLCDIDKVIILHKENQDLADSMSIIEEAYTELFGIPFPTNGSEEEATN